MLINVTNIIIYYHDEHCDCCAIVTILHDYIYISHDSIIEVADSLLKPSYDSLLMHRASLP